jgi:ribosomal protein L37E
MSGGVNERNDMKMCLRCGDSVSNGRYALGYKYCLACGDLEAQAKMLSRTIAPMNKSNYMVITDLELLKQLNPKRTT